MMSLKITTVTGEVVWDEFSNVIPIRGEIMVLTASEDGIPYDPPRRYMVEKVENWVAEERVECLVTEVV